MKQVLLMVRSLVFAAVAAIAAVTAAAAASASAGVRCTAPPLPPSPGAAVPAAPVGPLVRLAAAEFAEGPLPTGPPGALLFTDIPPSAVRHIGGDTAAGTGDRRGVGQLSTWWASSGHANGLASLGEGRGVVAAQHGPRRVVVLPPPVAAGAAPEGWGGGGGGGGHDGDGGGGVRGGDDTGGVDGTGLRAFHGAPTVVVSHFAGRRLNLPNDVAPDGRGGLYFTDPPYGFIRGDAEGERELAFSGIYYLLPGGIPTPTNDADAADAPPARAEPRLVLIDDSLPLPNGIVWASGGRLIVSDSAHAAWYTYERCWCRRRGRVDVGGGWRRRRLAADPAVAVGGGLVDGLGVDAATGFVYGTGVGGIVVLNDSPGLVVPFLATPLGAAAVTNVAVGAGRWMYVTTNEGVYRARLPPVGAAGTGDRGG